MRRQIFSAQKGYFLLLAVFFIMVIGVMGSLMAYLFSNRAQLSVNQLNGLKTFYNAESGMDIATHYLWRGGIGATPARLSCAAVTGTAALTNASMNGGTFTVTTTSSPVSANSTLSTSETATDLVINLTSSSGFAGNGRVVIDREVIDYASVSGNTLIGVTRGAGGTLASSHASGASVAQYQCPLDVQAGIPNLTSPTYKRQLQWNVQLQEAWAVADLTSSNFNVTHWNKPTEIAWTASTVAGGSNVANLNAVSMLSNASGWAVGDEASNNFIFLRWNGTSWAVNALAGACNNQHLQGVSMVSSLEGYAVGVRYRPACAGSGNYRYALLRWNGTAWSLLTPTTSPSIPADASSTIIQNLNGVHVIDTNGDGLADTGFAVGNSGTILRYNGSNWIRVTPSPAISNNLIAVHTVSASEAWMVGQNGSIYKWNGSTVASVTSPVTSQLSAVAMVDLNGDGLAEFGVAGGASAKALIYNGSTWSVIDLGSTTFLSAAAYNDQDAWLGGSGGGLYHWDGSAWTSVASGTTRGLNGISLVPQGNPPTSAWEQVFR